jgi:hypothetical protein
MIDLGLTQRLRRVRKNVVRHLYINAEVDLAASIILAGSGRSGTTWIAEIINYDNQYRFVFEPIRSEVIPSLRHFADKQYVRPGDPAPLFAGPVDEILRGRVRNPHVDKHNMRLFSRKALFKEIRGHLLLRWLHERYPMIPIVFLLRHPCAVAKSKQRIGWGTEGIELFLEQEELVSDYLGDLLPEIRRTSSEFERYVWIWCIENYVALDQFRDGGMHVVFYEDFCERPAEAARELFAYLNKPFDRRARKVLQRPSATTRAADAETLRAQFGNWGPGLTTSEKAAYLRILSLFGLDAIYGEGSRPAPGGLAAFYERDSIKAPITLASSRDPKQP